MNKKMYAILASYIILTVSMGEQALAFETDKIYFYECASY